MDLDIKGRTALVCASSKGLGRGCAEALAAEGVDLVLNARGSEALEATAASIREAYGVAVTTVAADITSEAGQAAVLAAAGDVDILVTNAGGPPPGMWTDWDRDDFIAAFDANLLTPIALIKALLPGMMARGWGRIVNIGSINGQAGQYGQVNYAAAKSGIHGFTKALAQEGARFGITVNAIAPGYIDTDMVAAVPEPVLEKIVAKIPVGRLGKASEIARGVSFLCSDHAEFVTGSTMSINGGQHMY